MRSRAFSLVELLVVMALIGVLATLAIPAIGSIQRASALSSAENELTSILTLARQTAIAQNQEVEVRLIRFKDPAEPGSEERLGAFQLFTYNTDGQAIAVSRLKKLPSQILIDSGTTLSTLADPSLKKGWGAETKPPVSGVGTSYEAWSFRFRPDGSANVPPFPSTPWFLTLHDVRDGDNLAKPPANYVTLVMDAVNGNITTWRP